MRLLPLAFAIIVLASGASAGDPVLLVSRRGGWIEAIDPQSLQTVGRVRVGATIESVTADSAGRRFFLTAPSAPGKPCCALFAWDPQSPQLSLLVEPAQSATVTTGRLFTQRGNVGIEVFDPDTLTRLPTIKAPGVYRLQPSPDGRLLFGITHFPRPSLDLFDAVQGVRIASQLLPNASSVAGTWVGDQYFLFTEQAGQAALWPVSPYTGSAGQAMPLSLSFPDCVETPYAVIASGDKLAIYAQFGLKSNGACAGPGGFVIADPNTGAVSARLAASRNFRQMVASPDGRYLYGLDVGAPAWQVVQIVMMNASTGQVVGAHMLQSDVWHLTSGQLPHGIAPGF